MTEKGPADRFGGAFSFARGRSARSEVSPRISPAWPQSSPWPRSRLSSRGVPGTSSRRSARGRRISAPVWQGTRQGRISVSSKTWSSIAGFHFAHQLAHNAIYGGYLPDLKAVTVGLPFWEPSSGPHAACARKVPCWRHRLRHQTTVGAGCGNLVSSPGALFWQSLPSLSWGRRSSPPAQLPTALRLASTSRGGSARYRI